MRRSLLVVCVLALSCVPKTGSLPKKGDAPVGQLPSAVTPVEYRLHLDIDPRRDDFSGEVYIEAALHKPTRHIWLHGNGLSVEVAEVIPAGGTPVKAAYEQRSEGGVVSLDLERILAPGRVTLHFVYTAKFDRQLRGLYLVEVGEDRYAFSQLESLDARRVFPSFDEPRFKTPFHVSVTTNGEDVVAANMSVVTETMVGEGQRRTVFAKTPPLPTYLLAWAVGPLEVVDVAPIATNDVRAFEIPFRGLAPRGRADGLGYALEITPDLLHMLELYTGIGYPYDKLDVVAVPDFAYGAMENPGLITYRETRLLLDEDNASAGDRQALLGTTAHELAHMWFGNLVTTAWWDDIWLNEAFATWLGTRVSHAYDPDMRFDLRAVQRAQGAMNADSYDSSRRIREPIKSDHDVRNAFDGITYSKGGAVLGMFEGYLGPDEFRKGIQTYLNDNADKSVTLDAFSKALTKGSGTDLTAAFDSFLNQSGVPFLDVSVSCSSGDARIQVQQSRYLPKGSQADSKRSWIVPMCVRYGTGTTVETQCELVKGRESSFSLDNCPDWVFPNANANGYYRWRLDDEALRALQESGVEHLSERELMSLVDSVGAALSRGDIRYADAMNVLLPLAAHENRFIATAPMGALRFAQQELVVEQVEKVQALAHNTYGPVWELMKNDRQADAQFREQVASFLAFTARDEKVRSQLAGAGRQYVGWKSNGAINRSATEPEMVALSLQVAAQEEGAEFMAHLVELLQKENDATVRWQLIAGLAAITDAELGARVRNLTGMPNLLRGNERSGLISIHRGFPENREPTWVWFKANIDAIRAMVPAAHAAGFPSVAEGFSTTEKANEVEAFFAPFIEEVPGGPRTLKRTLEGIRLKAARIDAQRADAKAYFDALEI